MRSIEDIRDTGAAWVTEAEVAMLCAFAKRAETSEMEVARLTRERDEEREATVVLTQERNRLERERDEARARLARCVEALEAVHGECPGWISSMGSAHDPRCDGTCSVGCPVPVEELEPCQVCDVLAAAKGE